MVLNENEKAKFFGGKKGRERKKEEREF